MRDLLRFITCGSVDDGKSTLIGHILYDAKLLYADQEKALALESKAGSRGGKMDYSLLLDGLTEEREQGITIDVAYRYFTTEERSFIVADTPGHEEYTRNMAVGASTADLAVILVDAGKGVLTQTKRHARICSIMGIRHFVFAINKMDLLAYEEDAYRIIEQDVQKLCRELGIADVKSIPVSATEGDNVSRPSENMGWYAGETLLSYLESVDVSAKGQEEGFYLPVQRVCRPDHSFRGFQGQIESGRIHAGEEVRVLPRREKARVKKILLGARECGEAFAGQAVTIQLDREIDVSRGSVIEKDSGISAADSVTVTLIWMDEHALENGGNYFIKLGTSLLPGVVSQILHKIDVNTGASREASSLCKNEIGVCKISFTDRIPLDLFQKHKSLGELILIDRVRFMTSACGVVGQYAMDGGFGEGRISERTRSAVMGQRAVTVVFDRAGGIGNALLWEVEKQLILEGRYAYFMEDGEEIGEQEFWRIADHLNRAGVLLLVLRRQEGKLEPGAGIRAVAYTGKDTDKSSIVSFIKKLSSYDYNLSEGALYI